MNEAYILFKDHGPNKLQSRLINPSKTELGKISKNTLAYKEIEASTNIRVFT